MHALNRHKQRNISKEAIAETIREGTEKYSHKDGCSLYVYEHILYDHPLGVVVNTTSGKILTVEYRR